jgi:hypothetical protein
VPPIVVSTASSWERVLAQSFVRDVASRRPCGQVQEYNPDLHYGIAYIGAVGTFENRKGAVVPK